MVTMKLIRFLINKAPSLQITRLLIKNLSYIDIATSWIDIFISFNIFCLKFVICLALQLNVINLLFHIIIKL